MSRARYCAAAIAAVLGVAAALPTVALAQQAAPTGVQASNMTPSSILLSWNAAPGATRYHVKRSGFEASTYATSFNFTGLSACTSYTLGVRALSGSSISPLVWTTAKTTGCSPAAPANSSPPAISGTAQQGQTLTASTGSWSNSPSSFAYQWQDCSSTSCAAIAGATGSSYVLSASDVGASVDVVVTASNAGGQSSATSAQTQVVSAAPAPAPPPAAAGLRVVGNQLENAAGQAVVVHGVDRNGTDYACEQGFGFTDGPSGDTEFSPMVSWKINSVVLGVNQDCWLGINGVQAQFAGQNYINFLKSEVASMEKYGIYPTIGFFVGEPGSDTPNWNSTGNGNAPMPNNDHVPLVWEEMANTFKSDPNVIFRLYEEPWPASNTTGLSAWQCWSQGDVQYSPSSVRTAPAAPVAVSSNQHCHESDAQGHAYQTVGMQSLVNIIRGTGASNVIQIPGVAFANMMACSNTSSPTQCGFLDSTDGVRITDPLSSTSPQLMADVDMYPDIGQYCSTVTCYNTTFAPVAAVMPFDAGELGVMNNSNPFPQAQAFTTWADGQHASYYGAAWDTWSDLISNYNGTPQTGFGQYYHTHISS